VKAGNYWRWLKRKLIKINVQFASTTHKLKLTASDGKKYNTDTLDINGVIELAKHFPRVIHLKHFVHSRFHLLNDATRYKLLT